ncbi:hypothetical protein JCM11641_002086 [Rhodosporidiobolus odoratus]
MGNQQDGRPPELQGNTEPQDRHMLEPGQSASMNDARIQALTEVVTAGPPRRVQQQGEMGEPEVVRLSNRPVPSGIAATGPPICNSPSSPLPPLMQSSADRLASQLAGTSSSATAPPLPRMRRTPRLSPNSRSERPAPAAVPSSNFSSFAPVDPTSSHRRPLRRQSSLPSTSTGRTRASSLDPPGMSRPDAGTSRSRRHLNPDEHWLSEDEADEQTRRSGPAARGRAAAPLRRPSDGDGNSDPDAPKLLSGELSLETATRHSIHQRPAKAFASESMPDVPPKPPSPPTPFSAIFPLLLSNLSCYSCHSLLRDPATFPCGHSRCLACEVGPQLAAATTTVLPALSTGIVRAASPPAAPQAVASHSIDTSSMPGSYFGIPPTSFAYVDAPHLRPPSVDLPKPRCNRATCSFPTTSCASKIPHVDFTLRKVVEAVRRALPSVDSVGPLEKVDSSSSSSAKARESSLESLLQDASLEVGEEKPPPVLGEIPRTGSSESGSSGGGESSPRAEDDGKRLHKTRGEWKTSKRTRVDPQAISDEPSRAPSPVSSRPRAPPPPAPSRPPRLDLSSVPPTFLSDLQNDLDCQVCVQLLHDPVTTPCGHSFCRTCLARAYDHSDKCPLCRADLPSLPTFRSQHSNATLTSIISIALPDLAAERASSIREDELAQLASVPIFVCTTAWPGIKTYLHIFEPHYRLMIRRALDSPDQAFGMVLPAKGSGEGTYEYGTMLRITSCKNMEDGRMILETVGTHRFRLVERKLLDGYTVGRIERVEDVSPEVEEELEREALGRNALDPEEDEDEDVQDSRNELGRPSRPPMTGNVELPTEALMQICLDFIRTLRAGSAPWVIERLNRTVGEMPTHPQDFTWFAAEVFPVEDHVKAVLLQITSVRERLRLIVFWIEQFRSSWWYTRGCSIS